MTISFFPPNGQNLSLSGTLVKLRLDLVLQPKLLLATSLSSVARHRAGGMATGRVRCMATGRASCMATIMPTAVATAITKVGDVDAVKTMSGVLIKLGTLRQALGDVHPLFFEKACSSSC